MNDQLTDYANTRNPHACKAWVQATLLDIVVRNFCEMALDHAGRHRSTSPSGIELEWSQV